MYLEQCEGTMPITSVYKQVKELSHKLEQVAKQRQMEEEIAELKKHQAKIVELKQRVGKLTTKCQLWYAQTREDKVHVQHTLRVAALILELADRLTAQEEQARQTSTEVQQQISASFQPLPTNITKSKKEDIQKGGDSAKITPHTNGDGDYTPPPRYVNSSCIRCNLHTYWMFVDLLQGPQ
jgi:vacuolar-type H+-ATPase subunit I/STV1